MQTEIDYTRILEKGLAKAGWYRSPNNWRLWYAGHQEIKRPAFPLEVRVTDAIWVVSHPYGQVGDDNLIPLLKFDTVESFILYCETRGIKGEEPGFNVWD